MSTTIVSGSAPLIANGDLNGTVVVGSASALAIGLRVYMTDSKGASIPYQIQSIGTGGQVTLADPSGKPVSASRWLLQNRACLNWAEQTLAGVVPRGTSNRIVDGLMVVAPTGSATGASVTGSGVAPYALTAGQTAEISINGAAGLTATFLATAASLTAGNAGPYTVTNGETLLVTINGTPTTITMPAIVAQTAAATAVVLNGLGTVGITFGSSGASLTATSTQQGTGSELHFTGGSGASVFNFSGTDTNGTGNVANIAATTQAEVNTVLGGVFTGTSVTGSTSTTITTTATGSAETLQVISAGTTASALGLPTSLVNGTNGGTTQSTGAVAPLVNVNIREGLSAFSGVLSEYQTLQVSVSLPSAPVLTIGQSAVASIYQYQLGGAIAILAAWGVPATTGSQVAPDRVAVQTAHPLLNLVRLADSTVNRTGDTTITQSFNNTVRDF